MHNRKSEKGSGGTRKIGAKIRQSCQIGTTISNPVPATAILRFALSSQMASGLAGNGDFFPSSIALLKTCAIFLLLPPFVASAKMMGKDGEQWSRLPV